jgi:hypothetical protein
VQYKLHFNNYVESVWLSFWSICLPVVSLEFLFLLLGQIFCQFSAYIIWEIFGNFSLFFIVNSTNFSANLLGGGIPNI